MRNIGSSHDHLSNSNFIMMTYSRSYLWYFLW